MKKMKFIYYYLPIIMVMVVMFSCKEDEENSSFIIPYDPGKPTKLLEFYPDSGGIATQVILKGDNFETNKENLKVYFNKKEATVVESTGDMLYVITPKQPGDTCTISVVNNKDSLIYDNKFTYVTQVTVSTICGIEGAAEIKDGDLAEATFYYPCYICVDDEKNIFVTEMWAHTLRHINEEKHQVYTLMKGNGLTNPNAPCVAPDQSIFIPLDAGNVFYQFDPLLQWSPKKIRPQKKSGTQDFVIDWKHSLALQKSTGLLYTRAYNGQLIKINPYNKESELVAIDLLPGSDSFLQFCPGNDDVLYIAYSSKHCIFTYDLTTGEHTLYAGMQNEAGYMDGERLFTKFKNPRQMCFDEDKNMYIADEGNHCIRKIDSEGIVSVVVGIPGMKGYLDGDPEMAMFNQPRGVAIDEDGIIYVADTYNHTIRKLSIQ